MTTTGQITLREKEILSLIADEKTSNEISKILHISPDTAKSHRKNLFNKLQARNAAGLIRRAYEAGILKIKFS